MNIEKIGLSEYLRNRHWGVSFSEDIDALYNRGGIEAVKYHSRFISKPIVLSEIERDIKNWERHSGRNLFRKPQKEFCVSTMRTIMA